MGFNMKKYLILLLLFSASPSYASFQSVVMSPAGALWAMVSPVPLIAGILYSMKSGSTSTVSPSGIVTRPSEAQWIDLTLTPPVVLKKSLNASMPVATVMAIGTSRTSGVPKYPNVNNVLNGVNTVPLSWNTPDGSLIFYDATSNTAQKVILAGETSVSNGYAGQTTWVDPGKSVCITGPANSGPSNNAMWRQYFISTISVLPTPIAASFVAKALTTIDSGGPLFSAYQAELDKMFQDPNYIPTFSDSTTGLPPIYSNVSTPAQVDTYNKAGIATSAAAAAAVTAATSAAAAAGSAQAAANTAAAASAANSSDTALVQAAKTAQAAADAAKVISEKLAAQQLKSDAAAAAAAKSALDDAAAAVAGAASVNDAKYDSYTESLLPSKSDIKGAIQAFINSSPLIQLVKKLSVTVSNSNPATSFIFHGISIPIDFSRWAGPLAAAGAAFLSLSHMFALYIVFRREG